MGREATAGPRRHPVRTPSASFESRRVVGKAFVVRPIALGDVPVHARVNRVRESAKGEPLDLTEADINRERQGRAMQGPENFEILRKLLQGAGRDLSAPHAPRWTRDGSDHSHQVGQTGKL
jgi:electron transfer flavoprotein alpha subunit